MEKFSTWRDASSGIAPFVLPVPTGDDTLTPLLLVAKAVLSVFGVLRIAIFCVLVGLFVVLDSTFSLIAVCKDTLPKKHNESLCSNSRDPRHH
jgi:hypothetical protein